MSDAQEEGKVGSRTDWNPFIGDFGQFTETGIDNDDFPSLFPGLSQLLHGGGNNSASVVAARKQHVFGAADVDSQLVGGHFVPSIGLGRETGGVVGDIVW